MRFVAGLLFALLLQFAPAVAEEAILSFEQRIEVARSGLLTVTETITVRAEGAQIRRGIYRDFPLGFIGDDGRRREATFTLLGTERDGRPEPYRQEGTRTGTRIYLGDPDVFLPSGVYRYQIRYETGRQIRFFEGHDELYWNVTGSEWAFPILKARAAVVLPAGAEPRETLAYTGRAGEQGRAYSVRDTAAGPVFETTRRLEPGEGLTIVLALAKGVIAPPTAADEAWYAFHDRRGEILGIGGLLLAAGYYLWAWWRVGRDPPAGVVFPQFAAPKGVSPALANYISNSGGFSDNGWTALSATCVDLAVKGVLTFADLSGKVRLDLTGRPAGAALARGEREVADWFAAQGRGLMLDETDGTRVAALGSLHRSAIETDYRGKFYIRNGRHALLGILISVAAAAAMLAFGGLGENEIVIIPMLVFVSVWVGVFGGVALGLLGRFGLRPQGRTLMILIGVAMFALAELAVTFNEWAGLGASMVVPLSLFGLLAVNVVFVWLLGAPTLEGRALMDKVEGLKLYLSVAEADRMNMAGAPAMSPNRYETLLPYAIALGVERPWTESFNAWLASATAAEAAAYQPGWYRGSGYSRAAGFSPSVSDELGSMARSFASSVPAPKSSSSGSGGGGSSGGGGGGGGGGGW